jgi:glycosyltransferase involved in cell wall biosynthesis
MRRNLKGIAVVPAFNEEAAIRSVITRTQKHVDMVIVVDDGSSDKTIEIARSVGAFVIRHVKNKGYGAALKTCFEAARKVNADWMVIIDGDGQHDPDEIPIVLAPIISGEADIVVGSRFINKKQNNVPIYRKLGIKILNFVTRLVGPEVLDSQSGFRAYSRSAISIIDPTESGMGAGSEILIQGYENGLRIKEVPATCNYQVKGSTGNPVFHGLRVLSSLIRLANKKRRMYERH